MPDELEDDDLLVNYCINCGSSIPRDRAGSDFCDDYCEDVYNGDYDDEDEEC